MEKNPIKETSKERKVRKLALDIALNGAEEVKEYASAGDVQKAEEYLASLATYDGRVELGGMLLVLKDTINRAREEGAYKIVIDGTVRLAELARLVDFSSTITSARAAQEEREAQAVAYLESTGVIRSGLDLLEAARLVAQYVVDEILPRKIKEEKEGAKQ